MKPSYTMTGGMGELSNLVIQVPAPMLNSGSSVQLAEINVVLKDGKTARFWVSIGENAGSCNPVITVTANKSNGEALASVAGRFLDLAARKAARQSAHKPAGKAYCHPADLSGGGSPE